MCFWKTINLKRHIPPPFHCASNVAALVSGYDVYVPICVVFAKIYAIVHLQKQLLCQPASNHLETEFCFSLTDVFVFFNNILLE